jgi:hypothetical protein
MKLALAALVYLVIALKGVKKKKGSVQKGSPISVSGQEEKRISVSQPFFS